MLSQIYKILEKIIYNRLIYYILFFLVFYIVDLTLLCFLRKPYWVVFIMLLFCINCIS